MTPYLVGGYVRFFIKKGRRCYSWIIFLTGI